MAVSVETEHLIGAGTEFLKGNLNGVVAIGDEGNLQLNSRDDEKQRPLLELGLGLMERRELRGL